MFCFCFCFFLLLFLRFVFFIASTLQLLPVFVCSSLSSSSFIRLLLVCVIMHVVVELCFCHVRPRPSTNTTATPTYTHHMQADCRSFCRRHIARTRQTKKQSALTSAKLGLTLANTNGNRIGHTVTGQCLVRRPLASWTSIAHSFWQLQR